MVSLQLILIKKSPFHYKFYKKKTHLFILLSNTGQSREREALYNNSIEEPSLFSIVVFVEERARILQNRDVYHLILVNSPALVLMLTSITLCNRILKRCS